MSARKDHWEQIIKYLGIDLTLPVSREFSADDIKSATSGYEPRLLASMDSESKVPPILRDCNAAVYATGWGMYRIAKGRGYHRLEQMYAPAIEHVAAVPPVVALAGGEKHPEAHFLNYAYNVGLFERFLGVKRVWLGESGKTATPQFRFHIGSRPAIDVNRAEIEIDGSYVGNGDYALVEAKAEVPDTFFVKQLYYPFRTLRTKYPRSHIRPIFFAHDKRDDTYAFWEYDFADAEDYESITNMQRVKFRITVQPVDARSFVSKELDIGPIQANDIGKILDFPKMVGDGIVSSIDMARAFSFTQRQSSYYRQAAEALGFVSFSGNRYRLTRLGERFIQLPTPERNRMACELLFREPIMHRILERLIRQPSNPVSRTDVMQFVREVSEGKVGGDTLARRAQSYFSWLRWVQRTAGIVIVRGNEAYLVSSYGGLSPFA